jgi:F-type H+-transporting ATPase subunit delta
MNDSKISVRYSRALFESAVEKKVLERIYQDMIFVLEVCSMNEMKEFLVNPVIRPSKKTKILLKVFEGNIEELTVSLVKLAVNNGREAFLPGIARVFIKETKAYRGITESVLTTAIKVDDKLRKQIIDLISGIFKTKVELKEMVDKDIIGGFVLRIEDNLMDASIRTKLRKIEKELIGKAILS